jgi:cell pole-organizing protein PopZ
MEEILASIRRIISEDEGQSPQQDAAPEGYVRPAGSEDAEEGIADTQIIADIERVLAGASGPAEPVEDEILDLTDAGAAAEDLSPDVVEELAVVEVVEEIAIDPVPAPTFAQAFPPDAPDAAEPEAPAEPVAAMEPQSYEAPHYVAEEPQPAPAPSYAPPEPMQAAQPAEDPTAALERAIAALKAGDLAAFAREAESKHAAPAPSPVVAEAPPQAPVYEPLPAAGPTLAEQFAAPEEPQAAPLEEELVILSEPELQPEAPEPTAWSPPEEAQAPEGVATPWHSDETTWSPKTAPTPDFAAPAPDYAAPSPRTNGGSGHKPHDFAVTSPKSLEDSVKEMLRPMLRKWLDENMQRVLTQALREELEDPETRRRQG